MESAVRFLRGKREFARVGHIDTEIKRRHIAVLAEVPREAVDVGRAGGGHAFDAIDQRAWQRDWAPGAGSGGAGNCIPYKEEILFRCKLTTYKLPLLLATGKVVKF